MPAIDQILAANHSYAGGFTLGDLPMPPSRKLAILTCMDARIVPARAFGIAEGEAHVIRNAGGRARDALRSLIISQRLLGTRDVAVVHHTDCGMLTFTNQQLRARVRDDLGQDTGEFDFLPFDDVEASVREDVEFLLATQLLDPETVIRGLVYDVRSGQLREVPLEAPAPA